MAEEQSVATAALDNKGMNIRQIVSATGKAGDAILFAIFAGLGIGTEVAIHHFTDNALVIIAGPLAVLGLYVFATLTYRRIRLRFDQLGDNCYYLGFLFTLTALSIALVGFRGHKVEIDTIVANFGVALASTIAGVALRVFLSQMREDPLEVEEQSRYELAQAAAMLKNELFASVRDMNNFRGVIQQSIAESFEEVNERSKEAILNAAEGLVSAAKSINEEIAVRNEQLNERFDRFNDLTHRSVSSLETLVESIERIRPPNELIHEAFERSIRSVERLGAEIEKISKLSERHRETTEQAIAASASSMQKLSENLSGIAGPWGALNQVTDNLQQVTKNLNELSSGFRRASEELSESVAAHRQNLDTYKNVSKDSADLVQTYNLQLMAGLEKNREMLSEIEHNLADMARALAKAVG